MVRRYRMFFRTDRGLGCLAILVCVFGLLCLIPPSFAQEQQEAAAEPPPRWEELQDLLATLENDAERAEFTQRLRSLIAARRAVDGAEERSTEANLGGEIMATISAQVSTINHQARAALAVVGQIPQASTDLLAMAGDAERRSLILAAAAKVILIIALGFLAEWVAKRLLSRRRQQVATQPAEIWHRQLQALFRQVLVDVVPLFAFAAATYGLLPLTQPKAMTQLVILAIVNANVLVRAIMIVTRAAFSPDNPTTRAVRVSEETAHYWVIWVRRLSALAIYGYFFVEAALLLGLAAAAHKFFLNVLVFLVLGLVVVLVFQNKSNVAGLISSRDAADSPRPGSLLRESLADTWHIFAVLFVVVLYAVWLFEIEGGFQYLLQGSLLSLFILAISRVLVLALQQVVARGFRLRDTAKLRYPDLEPRANLYLAKAQGALKFIIQALAVLFLLEVWGADVSSWVTSPIGSVVLARAASILLLLLGAYIVWEVFSLLIQRYLERRDSSGALLLSSSRTRTLLPLFRNTVRIVLIVLVALTMISEFGIDIAPLLAGAGVFGLAIGFGAQSLIKDVITGVFILLEDALAVGDYVDLGGHMGTVEGLTIRSVTLRDIDGNVHIVPFGEVAAVLNMAKEFGISLIDVGVAYRENVDEVIEVLKEIGAGLQADENWRAHIIGPYEVLGLHKFEDSAVIIRTRFKTKPMMQWSVRREFHLRMKRAFDARNIEIPFPHQTIYFGADREGKAPGIAITRESSS